MIIITKINVKTIFSLNHNSHNPIHKSTPDLAKLSKTYWPVPYIESTFLSHFNIATANLNGKFKFQSYLEKGASGSVYRVKSTENDQEYALKIIQKSNVS